MADTFTWRPDKSAPATMGQRTRSAQFGSGYTQEAGDGLNTETQSWALTFTGDKSRIIQIRNFLRDQGGYKAFIWSTPLDGPLYFKCKTYTPTPLGGTAWTLAATFELAPQVT